MSETIGSFNEEERLRSENEFLKMKLMLERGAEFSHGDPGGLDPGLENAFLNNIIEFENQFEACKRITVFDRLGKPEQFIPVAAIAEENMDEAWEQLSAFLYKNGISLGVCSPNVSSRELYRFTIEELFKEEIDDLRIAGMIQAYVYDEFHPDHRYENAKAALEECMESILKKEPLHWMYHFEDDRLQLNDHFPLSVEEFKYLVNRFKKAYTRLEIVELVHTDCVLEDKACRVTGNYSIRVAPERELYTISGNWQVDLELDDEFGYWYITKVRVEGIEF